MTKRSLPFRTNYFSLAVCKHIFRHPAHGLVFVRDAMQCREAEKYELSPLLIYALSVPGTAIRRMTFAPLEQPRALYATLHRLWTQEAEGFRGRPDALVVSRQVAAASPTLGDRLTRDGMELIVPDSGEKISAAALRTAQQDAMWLDSFPDGQRIDTLDRLDEVASERHRSDVKRNKGKDQLLQEKWAALPCRPSPAAAYGNEMDWSPGPWLSSWEGSLPPVSQPRYFYADSPDRKVWLLTGSQDDFKASAESNDEPAENQEWEDEDDLRIVELAKDLVTCWPNGAAEIARSIGSTARDLRWFLDGKAGLSGDHLSELLSMLGIEPGGQGYYEAAGPCVLIAKAVGAASRVYLELSAGGDLAFAFEVVPESGQPDPSWRYLLFQGCGGLPSIMMFERGSTAAERLNNKTFMKFEGVRPVPSKVYRDVVATAARASQSPLVNRSEMLGFDERQPTVSW